MSQDTDKPKKPRVILGVMTFGPDVSLNARVTSLDEYNTILDYLQSQGYNEIDTARNYVGGQQEGFTRAAHWKERGLTCATKCYPSKAGDHEPEKLEGFLNKSLSELGTDCVDIWYLHAPDRSVPFEKTLQRVNEMYKQGKFRRLGLSNFAAFELAEIVMTCKANGWVRPTIFQCRYNAITRSIEPDLVAACRRYGLDIVVYNPIAVGLLSGKYKTSEIPMEGRFSNTARQGAAYRKRYFTDIMFDALSIIEPAAAEANLTLLEIAYRWLCHHSALNIKDGGNDGIIVGVSSLQQLEQNLRDIQKGPLPDNVLKALDEAWLLVKPTISDYWHGELTYGYDTQKTLGLNGEAGTTARP